MSPAWCNALPKKRSLADLEKEELTQGIYTSRYQDLLSKATLIKAMLNQFMNRQVIKWNRVYIGNTVVNCGNIIYFKIHMQTNRISTS